MFLKKLILPVIVLGALVALGMFILRNPPESSRGGPPPTRAISVEVNTVQPSAYKVSLASFGSVQPRTQSALTAQVSGQITQVNESLRPGGFFAEGDVLLAIDPRDFEADVQISQAAAADARQLVLEESARGEQAMRDWKRLGNNGEPNAMVLRQPQLQAAEARLASAEASLSKAKLSVERSQVRAPYAGRVLQQQVDLGQVVSVGTVLANIYATDLVEVRLPLRNADLRFIDLPEGAMSEEQMPDVEIFSDLGERTIWSGKIVRTDGAIDPAARQLHVVAQIDDPFSTEGPRRPLKIGEYVTASIAGRQLIDARVIPVQTIYQNSFVYIAEEGLLARRNIKPLWQNETDALIAEGLEFGDQLVITPLGQVSSGMPVKITRSKTDLLSEKRGVIENKSKRSAPIPGRPGAAQ